MKMFKIQLCPPMASNADEKMNCYKKKKLKCLCFSSSNFSRWQLSVDKRPFCENGKKKNKINNNNNNWKMH